MFFLFPMSQSLFYWIIYSYKFLTAVRHQTFNCLNPYFTGLSILIITKSKIRVLQRWSQSLFYWIIYSYISSLKDWEFNREVSILILLDYLFLCNTINYLHCLHIVSILILLDYLFLLPSI